MKWKIIMSLNYEKRKHRDWGDIRFVCCETAMLKAHMNKTFSSDCWRENKIRNTVFSLLTTELFFHLQTAYPLLSVHSNSVFCTTKKVLLMSQCTFDILSITLNTI